MSIVRYSATNSFMCWTRLAAHMTTNGHTHTPSTPQSPKWFHSNQLRRNCIPSRPHNLQLVTIDCNYALCRLTTMRFDVFSRKKSVANYRIAGLSCAIRFTWNCWHQLSPNVEYKFKLKCNANCLHVTVATHRTTMLCSTEKWFGSSNGCRMNRNAQNTMQSTTIAFSPSLSLSFTHSLSRTYLHSLTCTTTPSIRQPSNERNTRRTLHSNEHRTHIGLNNDAILHTAHHSHKHKHTPEHWRAATGSKVVIRTKRMNCISTFV